MDSRDDEYFAWCLNAKSLNPVPQEMSETILTKYTYVWKISEQQRFFTKPCWLSSSGNNSHLGTNCTDRKFWLLVICDIVSITYLRSFKKIIFNNGFEKQAVVAMENCR